jgi:Dolichyl-phosphate-mannose-protein mannosyltransferase
MGVIWSTAPWAISDRLSRTIKNRELICGTAVVLLVGIISITLTLQGWKSRVPAFDLLTHIYNAHGFIESGILPQHGDTGSYGSYKPAGTAWLMMPSTLLLGDPRLSEYVGAAFLHFATLLGIFLLAWRCFGAWPAYLAVLLYGLSPHGLFLAGSLWPNGRPDFYIWFVLLTSQWVIRQDARYLAAALAVWGVGMQVDMAIAPAFFILPFIWLYYRPPVRLAAVLVAGLIVLTAWGPYLSFEATRGFADIKSQLLLQNIFPARYKQSWCDPNSTLHIWNGSLDKAEYRGSVIQNSKTADTTGLRSLLSRMAEVKDKVLSNFTEAVNLPGVNFALLAMVLCGLLLCSVQGFSNERPEAVTRSPLQRWLKPLAFSFILSAPVANALIIARLLGNGETLIPAAILAKLSKLLLIGGLVLLAGPWLTATIRRILTRIGLQLETTEQAEMRRLLVFSLVIPWFILVVVAEPGKPERFWWLWPPQVIFLSAFVTYVLGRFTARQAALATAQLAVALVLIVNPFLLSRINSWLTNGWPGADAEEIRMIDAVSHQIKAEGKDQAAIGYRIFVYPFMANYNITNSIYKVGAVFDLLFKYRHGITNTNQCAEGVSPDDEYRVIQTRRKSHEAAARDYFEVPLDKSFRLLRSFDLYQVFKRD